MSDPRASDELRRFVDSIHLHDSLKTFQGLCAHFGLAASRRDSSSQDNIEKGPKSYYQRGNGSRPRGRGGRGNRGDNKNWKKERPAKQRELPLKEYTIVPKGLKSDPKYTTL